jgi:hypothetical protein
MVKIVYDPDGKIMEKDLKNGSGDDDEEMK